MRSFVLAILALSVATPAVAASESQRDMEKMATVLQNPGTQAAVADTLGSLFGAFLDMRVDGIAKALEPMNGGKKIKMRGRTLREMAEREDPRFEQKLEGGTRAMVGGMGAMAAALAAAMPQLEAAMDKAGEAMDRAGDRAGNRADLIN